MYSPKGGILLSKISRISILIVPEEGWFGQLKCSTEIMPTPRSDGSCFQKRYVFFMLLAFWKGKYGLFSQSPS